MKTYHKKNPACADNMTFEDCELAILRQAVDENENILGAKIANSEDIKKIINIVENFLIRKKRICYGGTAINNILPSFAQFYNRDIEIPDYDFFSDHALEDAKELADIYYDAGYTEVEAKSGMHHGTFKVFVNFIPVADITHLEQQIYKSIQKECITRAGIKYAPPNFLRMSMFLELSRPLGDVSRWEKVLKRLTLLNKYYPLKTSSCASVDFQRVMHNDSNRSEKLYLTVRDTLIDQGVVFFGGYATSLYGRYMPANRSRNVKKIPDFDVLSEDVDTCALIVLESLKEAGFEKCKEIKHEAIGELIPERIEILFEKETVAFIYKPIACHNYNTITIADKEINVATIDTMLSFYLAFIYADLPYFNKDRILCMAEYLFDVEQQNRLEQKGLLKRFSISCYGKQSRLEDIRAEKTKKYKELAEKRDTYEYEMWFLKYIPENNRSKPAKKLIESKKSVTEKEKPKRAKNTTVKKSKQVRFMEIFK
jgi:hypothetical protein